MIKAFEVVTEFRFDIGHALLETERLQGAVQGISDSANNALVSFQSLGTSLVTQLGLGSGGLLGILTKAVQVSDKFNMSALGFSNIISANMDVFSGSVGTFNERLAVSRQILTDIATTAEKFSLDEGALLNMTKMIAPVLAPHGMTGVNMGNAIDLSRNVLKAAPTLGVDPNMVQGQLTNILMGSASLQDTLFRRLMTETQAFSGIKTSQQFNTLSFEKRFEMLHKGLNQFANDMDVVNGAANSLGGVLTRFKNTLLGLNSILKPLGDVLLPPIIETIKAATNMLTTQGREFIKHFSSFVKDIVGNPQQLLVTLMQIRQLSSDVKKASAILSFSGLIVGIGAALKFLGVTAALANPAIGGLTIALGVLFDFIMRGDTLMAKVIGVIGVLGALVAFFIKFPAVWAALALAAKAVLAPLIALVAVMQLFSRAQAIAKVEDAKRGIEVAPKIMELIARLKAAFQNIFFPIIQGFEALAQALSWFFSNAFLMAAVVPIFEGLVVVFEVLGQAVIYAMAGLNGLVAGLFAIFEAVKSGNFTGLLDTFMNAADQGIDDFIANNLKKISEGGNVVNQVTNIAKVEIRQEFKEQQEPDRIAFTIKDQLLKAAKNPVQSRGGGLQTAFAR